MDYAYYSSCGFGQRHSEAPISYCVRDKKIHPPHPRCFSSR